MKNSKILFSIMIAGAMAVSSAQAVIITDFSNFTESGNIVGSASHTRDQNFTNSGADITVAHVTGSNAGQEVFLTDEFGTLAAGDRISVDWDGTGWGGTFEEIGLLVASTEAVSAKEVMFALTVDPDGNNIRLQNWQSSTTVGTLSVSYSTTPDTLFIDRTASGWSFGSITGATETVHWANLTQVDGTDITADGSAFGLWSDMRTNSTFTGLSNLTIIPEPSTAALLGLGGLALLVLRRRQG